MSKGRGRSGELSLPLFAVSLFRGVEHDIALSSEVQKDDVKIKGEKRRKLERPEAAWASKKGKDLT